MIVAYTADVCGCVPNIMLSMVDYIYMCEPPDMYTLVADRCLFIYLETI